MNIKRWFVISIVLGRGGRTESRFESFAAFAPWRLTFFTNPRGRR